MFTVEQLAAGRIVHNDFHVNPDIPVSQQLDSLKEDMLQVELDGGFVLDVGWYPSFSVAGKFRVLLVKDGDWLHPVFDGSAKTLDGLQSVVEQSLKFAV